MDNELKRLRDKRHNERMAAEGRFEQIKVAITPEENALIRAALTRADMRIVDFFRASAQLLIDYQSDKVKPLDYYYPLKGGKL